VPSAVCLHGGGTPGLSVRGDGPYPAARAFHLMRGRWTILLKNYQLRTLLLLSPMLLCFELAQLLLIIRNGWVREWARAAREVASRLGLLARQREALQKNRRIADRDLLSGGPLPIRLEVPRPGLEKGALDVLNGCAELYWRAIRHVL